MPWSHRRGRTFAGTAAAVLAIATLGCGGSGGGTSNGIGSGSGDVPAVVADTPDALMAVLGPPDAFTRKVVTVGDTSSTVESLVYAELATRFDVVDGVVVGDEALEPFPDGTLLPLQFGFYDVRVGMTEQEVREGLDPTELTEVDGAALDLPSGSTILAGLQLLVGLQDGQVVYVQTFPLVPDETGDLQAYLDGDEP